MTLDVKFEEQDQTFNTNFGEIQTVSDGGFERGYNEGYAQGEVEGYDKGKTDGLVDGYDKGKTDGLVEGYDKGKTDGRVEGEQVGFDNALSKLTTLEVTENGEYTPSDDNIGFDKVTVNIGGEEKSKLAQYVEGTLTEITADDLKGATTFRNRAFAYNDVITKVCMPDTVSNVPSGLFSDCTNLKEVTLSKNVTRGASRLFSGCTKLENVYQMEQLLGFGDDMFMRCSSLKSISIPIGVSAIPWNSFSNCTSLVEVNLHNKITGIQTQAFYNCTSLTSLVIPSSVLSIGGSSLTIGSTSNKATITFLGTTPPSITTSTFNTSYLNKIIVPKGYGYVYKSATNWSKFADYIEEATE